MNIILNQSSLHAIAGGSNPSTTGVPKPQVISITDVSNKIFGSVTTVTPSGIIKSIPSSSVSASSITQSVFHPKKPFVTPPADPKNP